MHYPRSSGSSWISCANAPSAWGRGRRDRTSGVSGGNMSGSAAEALGESLALHLLQPPYDIERQFLPQTSLAEKLWPGSVLVVDLDQSVGVEQLAERLRVLRRRLPMVSLIVRAAAGQRMNLFEVWEWARMPVDGLVPPGPAGRATMVPFLADSVQLPQRVCDWLSMWRNDIDPDTLRAVESLLQVGGVSARRAPRRLSRRLRSLGLPPSASWTTLGRVLRFVLAIQREPRRALLSVALEQGYGGLSLPSRQARRLFRAAPGEIRRTIGWHGWVHRFVTAGSGR